MKLMTNTTAISEKERASDESNNTCCDITVFGGHHHKRVAVDVRARFQRNPQNGADA